jgi:hypothetical protein
VLSHVMHHTGPHGTRATRRFQSSSHLVSSLSFAIWVLSFSQPVALRLASAKSKKKLRTLSRLIPQISPVSHSSGLFFN